MVFSIWLTVLVFILISFLKNKDKTKRALKASFFTFKRMLPMLTAVIVLIGVTLAIVSQESLMYLFTYGGTLGFVLVSLVGAVLSMPGPIAFPLAGSLLKLGVSKAMLASFITTLTMVGVVSVPLEISAFGKRFTFIRQTLSFIAAVLIGLIMGAIYDWV